jgi:DNA-binding transcriptional MerR regulator
MTSPARTARSAPRKNSRPHGGGAEGGGGEQLLKIGEAAKLLGVEAYVLRFWETQFPFLRPRHAHSKHRFYAAQDLQALRLIKRLLHEERFTIEGAKKYIREVGLERALSAKPGAAAAHLEASSASGAGDSARRTLAEVRRELESLHKLLEN